MDRISRLRPIMGGSTTSIDTVATATHSLSALLESSMRFGQARPRSRFPPSSFPGGSGSSHSGSTSTSSSSELFLDDLDDEERLEPSFNLPYHPYARVLISGKDSQYPYDHYDHRQEYGNGDDDEMHDEALLAITDKVRPNRTIKFADDPQSIGSGVTNVKKKLRAGKVYQLRKSKAYLTLYGTADGYETPVFGRNGIVEGHITVLEPRLGEIKSIEARVSGKS